MKTGKMPYNRISEYLCVLLFCLLCAVSVSSCQGSTQPAAKTVSVSIAENEWITVQNNGQLVEEGQDAVFSLLLKDNYHITDVDYDGEYTLTENKNRALLTLKNVRYPVQVHLEAENQVWELTYEPNGAPGEAQTLYEEKGVHPRPNTSQGTELFSWDGHTLLGWNTEADGSGTSIGLGSRVTVPDGTVTLYAQWAEWTPEEVFLWEEQDGEAIITGIKTGEAVADGIQSSEPSAASGQRGTEEQFSSETLVIPETLGGFPVTEIAEGAFENLSFRTLSLPASMRRVADGAFRNCALEEIWLFDNIESISNAAFLNCENWKTIHINAAEQPFGTSFYKESCYADKVDLLILAQGTPKMVFYAGCSMWYNLDVEQVKAAYGERYQIIDMGLNGTVSSELQLQILAAFLEEGDVFFHTPELSSEYQMMTKTELSGSDGALWCGLEYNYDLVSLVDAQSVGDLLGSLCSYLDGKYTETDYDSFFEDVNGRRYFGENGEVPFTRTEASTDDLADEVEITPDSITDEGMNRLAAWYQRFADEGITVYLSYSALNMDALTTAEKNELGTVETRFQKKTGEMNGVTLISRLKDYEYQKSDFFDTNYHLLTNPAVKCTRRWLADLAEYLTPD